MPRTRLLSRTTAVVAISFVASCSGEDTLSTASHSEGALPALNSPGGSPPTVVTERPRIPVDETHYTFAEDPPANPFMTINGVRLRYSGMTVFADSAESPGSYWVRSDAPSHTGDLMETRYIDEQGRSWVSDQVYPQLVEQRMRDYDALVDQTNGLEDLEDIGDDPTEGEGEPGEWELFSPATTTWVKSACQSPSVIDTWVWTTDDRVPVFTPMSRRQRKVLSLTTPRGVCSGTMVAGNWLLTATHCLSDTTGAPFQPRETTACTYGNYQSGARCFTGTRLVMTRRYTGDGDHKHDYALLRLSGHPGVGWMALSQARESTIKKATGYNTGYPVNGPGCSFGARTPTGSSSTFAFQGYWSTGVVRGFGSSKIKTWIDGSGGQSGGPFYYYPDGCCGRHFLTGVYSGHFGSGKRKSYNGGPLAKAIRTWVSVFAD